MNNYSLYNYHLDLFLYHQEKLRFLITYHELLNEDNNIEIPDIPHEDFEIHEETLNDLEVPQTYDLRIFISTEKKIRRSIATQRRIRNTVNTIHNLVDNLVEILLPRTDPISQEFSERLGRIGTVLTAINKN